MPVKVFMDRVEQKDEFETAAAFQARQAAFWANSLGDASRIIIDAKLSPNGMDYDVEAGVLSIKWIVGTRPDGYTSSMQFSEKYRDRPSYVGQNAYGASVNVDSYSVTRSTLEFPLGQMLDDNGRGANMQWRLSMSPEDARAFKANPHMMVWASIKSPYLTTDVSLSKATIDYPTESSTHAERWSADIKCASFITGNRQFVKAITVLQ